MNEFRHPRCPYCSGLVEFKPREAGGFLCPTCHRALQAGTPGKRLLTSGAILCSVFLAWATGLRGLLIPVVVVPLSLILFVLGAGVIACFSPPTVRPYDGSWPLPRSGASVLGLSDGRGSKDYSRPDP